MRADEVICSDDDVHRQRLGSRERGIEGFPEPSWDEVLCRRDEWEPWADDHVVVDSIRGLDENVAEALDFLHS